MVVWLLLLREKEFSPYCDIVGVRRRKEGSKNMPKVFALDRKRMLAGRMAEGIIYGNEVFLLTRCINGRKCLCKY